MLNKISPHANCPVFILITPARNEEKFLPKVIKSVNKSSLRPALWVIVDDNSTDKTQNIIQDTSNKEDYIKLLRLNKKVYQKLIFQNSYAALKSLNISNAWKSGFDHVIELAHRNQINWEYIAVLDADTIVERTYFDNIINKMEKDPKIGIASGDIYVLENGKIRNDYRFRDRPSGTARIWRKNCFNQTGGICITHVPPDSVSIIKANLKGWKTVRFQEPRAYQLRETYSAKGLWKGYEGRGNTTYYERYHPLLVLAKGLSFMIKPKFYLVIPYFKGYLESMIRKEPRIQDEEIVEYYKSVRLNELLSQWRYYFWQVLKETK
jgi:glycosyltransferase involved in cell wall biosynthesis